MRHFLRALAVSSTAFLLGLSVAQAQTAATGPAEGFRVCNRSGQDVELATAVDLGDNGGSAGTYLSKGWYGFDNGQCLVMWPGTLQHRYFLIYAQNKDTGKEWKGDVPVCVSRDPFELNSPSCTAGKYSRPFIRIDTGNSASWTYNLLP
jgi:uncharacterized membrane protein